MNDLAQMNDELRKIVAAIQAQEALRGILPDERLDLTLAELRQKQQAILVKLETQAL